MAVLRTHLELQAILFKVWISLITYNPPDLVNRTSKSPVRSLANQDVAHGLTEASKAAALNLTQCAASANKGDSADHSGSGQDLEQVPGGIVQEEDSLESKQRSKECEVGKRSSLESGGEVVHVGTQKKPLYIQVSEILQTRPRRNLTNPAKTGRAAPTRPTKARVIITGGLVAASLNTWWISGSLPYRAASTVGTG